MKNLFKKETFVERNATKIAVGATTIAAGGLLYWWFYGKDGDSKLKQKVAEDIAKYAEKGLNVENIKETVNYLLTVKDPKEAAEQVEILKKEILTRERELVVASLSALDDYSDLTVNQDNTIVNSKGKIIVDSIAIGGKVTKEQKDYRVNLIKALSEQVANKKAEDKKAA